MFTKTLDRAYDLAHLYEEKVVRHVRTPAGQRRFGQPIGSVIVRDRKLNNLTGLDPIYDGWERLKGGNGKTYSVGHDEDSGKWIATEGDDDWNPVVSADSEEDVYSKLDAHAKGKGRGRGVQKNDNDHMEGLGPRQRSAVMSLPEKQQNDYAKYRRDGMTHREALESATKPKGRSQGKARSPRR